MIFFRTLQCNHKRTYYITSQYKLRRQSESEIRSFSRAFTYKDHRKRPSSKKSNIIDVEKGFLYEICSRDTPISPDPRHFPFYDFALFIVSLSSRPVPSMQAEYFLPELVEPPVKRERTTNNVKS